MLIDQFACRCLEKLFGKSSSKLMPFGRVGRYHPLLLLGHRKKCTGIAVVKGQCLQKNKKKGEARFTLYWCYALFEEN